MNKTKASSKPDKIKNMPARISFFVIFIIALEILYFCHFLTQGLFAHYGYKLENLSSMAYPTILVFLFAITAVSLLLVTYGLIYRRPWAKKFTMFFVLWSSVWPLWGLLVGNQPLLQLIMFVIYGFIFIYLMSSYIEDRSRDENVFRYGKYTLYKRDVVLKNGSAITIHFFSKKKPKSGTPTTLPSNYKIRTNKRSHIPYVTKRRIPYL